MECCGREFNKILPFSGTEKMYENGNLNKKQRLYVTSYKRQLPKDIFMFGGQTLRTYCGELALPVQLP